LLGGDVAISMVGTHQPLSGFCFPQQIEKWYSGRIARDLLPRGGVERGNADPAAFNAFQRLLAVVQEKSRGIQSQALASGIQSAFVGAEGPS
jgi:hypothetical protein